MGHSSQFAAFVVLKSKTTNVIKACCLTTSIHKFYLKVSENPRIMKIFNLLLVVVFGPKLTPRSESFQMLQPHMILSLGKAISTFNKSKHGHKREITFDPSQLGCEYDRETRLLNCRKGKVRYRNSHITTGFEILTDE